MKFGNATSEERSLFKTEWENVRDAFLTKPDWELFEGVEEPKKDVINRITLFGICGVIAVIAIAWYTKKRQ